MRGSSPRMMGWLIVHCFVRIILGEAIQPKQSSSEHDNQVQCCRCCLNVFAASLIVLASAACSSYERRGSFTASAPSIAEDTRGFAAQASATQASGEHNVAGDFYEVLMKWGASGADPRVRQWLEGRGLNAMSMKAGMLTIASPGQIEKSFGVSVQGAQPPLELRFRKSSSLPFLRSPF